MAKTLKFLNKIYKNTKKQIKDKIALLNKRNTNLNNKKISYENIQKELKKFIDDNKDKVKNNEKNVIHLENDNDNKQYISFMIDNNVDNDLELLQNEKKFDLCETERKISEKMELEYSIDSTDKNNEKAKSLNTKKLSMNKIFSVRNKLNEDHN